jgi:TRAP-type C4-dicarboxylate transport system permease small subunit
MKISTKVVSGLMMVALLAPFAASALTIETVGNTIGLGTADLKDTVVNIIQWVLGLLGLIAVIMILIGGFQWMTAGGNEEKVASAKKIISAAVIGLIVVLLAWAIVIFVVQTTSNVTT